MRKFTWIVVGSAGTLALLGVAALIFLRTTGLSARGQPSGTEEWLAETAREFAMPEEAKQLQNPIAKTPEVIREGMEHWADHCASCHANDGSGEIAMGRGFYPPAPDMRGPETQRMTDGELFYVIENGVRFTGMPAWGHPGHDGSGSWKLVHFIRHLPELTFEERREMEELNPKSPAEFEEERQQQLFLNGEGNQ